MSGHRGRGRPLVAPIAAVERTTLGWERTALGLAGLGALLLHGAPAGATAYLLMGGVLLTASLVVALFVAPTRHRRAAAAAAGGGTPVAPRLLLGLTVAIASVGVVLIVVEIVRRGVPGVAA